MKRWWKKVLRVLFFVDDKYRFYRKEVRREAEGHIRFKFTQRIYKKRRFFKVELWHGTIEVKVTLDGVKFRAKKDARPYLLHGTQRYTLRCDGDYVELLKHLAVVEHRGMLSAKEKLLVGRASELLMVFWPPGSNISVYEEEEKELDA